LSLVSGHSSFVLVVVIHIWPELQSCLDDSILNFWRVCKPAAHKTIVSPRAGPTLTIDNFPPVNSEIVSENFLAAGGSCEKCSRRVVDAFPTGISSYTASQLANWAGPSHGGTCRRFPFKR